MTARAGSAAPLTANEFDGAVVAVPFATVGEGPVDDVVELLDAVVVVLQTVVVVEPVVVVVEPVVVVVDPVVVVVDPVVVVVDPVVVEVEPVVVVVVEQATWAPLVAGAPTVNTAVPTRIAAAEMS